jgi:hypothetical protein
MSATKMIAVALIVLGIVGLMYGKFSYTKDTHTAKLGPIDLSVKEKETVNIRSGPASSRSWSEAACCSLVAAYV